MWITPNKRSVVWGETMQKRTGTPQEFNENRGNFSKNQNISVKTLIKNAVGI